MQTIVLLLQALVAADLVTTIPLEGNTHHVQGIVVERDRLFVTSVDVPARRGVLMEYELPSGKHIRSVEIHQGEQYHPGGLSAFGDSLWIPVAEYRRLSSAVIQKRSKRTLALEAKFSVPDHIGCVAVNAEHIVGGNWDARDLYVWDHSGKLLRKQPNPSGNAFQDLKFSGKELAGGGLLADRSGAVHWLDFPSLRAVKHLPVGKTDRGAVYTREGMAIFNGKLYLLPEDAPSRLFVFKLP